MKTLTLNDNEVYSLRMSIKNCIESCREGGTGKGCEHCQALQGVLDRL